jgi:hypothetical protein
MTVIGITNQSAPNTKRASQQNIEDIAVYDITNCNVGLVMNRSTNGYGDLWGTGSQGDDRQTDHQW